MFEMFSTCYAVVVDHRDGGYCCTCGSTIESYARDAYKNAVSRWQGCEEVSGITLEKYDGDTQSLIILAQTKF